MKKKITKKQSNNPFKLVEKEITFNDPVRGKVSQKVMVKVYPKQQTPEHAQYSLPINLEELNNEEDNNGEV